MEIKGNIGEEVYVKAIIDNVFISANSVCYGVKITDTKGVRSLTFEESEIKFEEKCKVKQPERLSVGLADLEKLQ